MIKSKQFVDGLAICGDALVEIPLLTEKYKLVICDPPYGNIVSDKWDKITTDNLVDWLIELSTSISNVLVDGGSAYIFGGVGKYKDRPFFKYLSRVENETDLHLHNLITWGKKRAYGVSHNYLFTREEIAFLVKGEKPSTFNIPLLSTKRGYAGYNEKYPAKSEFFRRTNVWSDITEIFKGKVHVAQKPEALLTVPILAHTEHGDTILDPCGGSFSTALAARSTGRKFVVIEKDETIFNKMIERL